MTGNKQVLTSVHEHDITKIFITKEGDYLICNSDGRCIIKDSTNLSDKAKYSLGNNSTLRDACLNEK
jgi:hypothetical protein